MKKLSSYVMILAAASLWVMTLLCVPSSAYEVDEEDIPWSGYWWSFKSGALVNGWGYRGHPAPLENYDYVTTGEYFGPAT
jgi:hypothetical protein